LTSFKCCIDSIPLKPSHQDVVDREFIPGKLHSMKEEGEMSRGEEKKRNRVSRKNNTKP
jgi:hypothetical protein